MNIFLLIQMITKITPNHCPGTAKQKANTMTVSWGGIGVLWGKNVAFLFIRDSRYTKEFLDTGEFFSVSFMGKEYKEALNYCGSHSGIQSTHPVINKIIPNVNIILKLLIIGHLPGQKAFA